LTGQTARDKVWISWKNRLIQNGESRDEVSRRRLGTGQGQQIPLRLKRVACRGSWSGGQSFLLGMREDQGACAPNSSLSRHVKVKAWQRLPWLPDPFMRRGHDAHPAVCNDRPR
jgi:hypothetical protein